MIHTSLMADRSRVCVLTPSPSHGLLQGKGKKKGKGRKEGPVFVGEEELKAFLVGQEEAVQVCICVCVCGGEGGGGGVCVLKGGKVVCVGGGEKNGGVCVVGKGEEGVCVFWGRERNWSVCLCLYVYGCGTCC